MKQRIVLICLTLLSTANIVSAHATLVRGALESVPEIPRANTQFRLRLGLLDPTEAPVQDAVIIGQFSLEGQEGEAIETSFVETDAAGIYESSPIVLPKVGRYPLLLRDQTYRQEEARANLTFQVGGVTPAKSYVFVFPPTATGSQNLWVWLLYVVLLPVGAAVVVTLWVLLRSSPKTSTHQS